MLSRTAQVVVQSLTQLARLEDGQFMGASALAERIGATGNYLGKLLQTMARSGLLESRKGLGGGFRLLRDPATVTLFEILDPIEPLERWNRCILGNPTCSDSRPCSVHDEWKVLRANYLDLLARTTLAEVHRLPTSENEEIDR